MRNEELAKQLLKLAKGMTAVDDKAIISQSQKVIRLFEKAAKAAISTGRAQASELKKLSSVIEKDPSDYYAIQKAVQSVRDTLEVSQDSNEFLEGKLQDTMVLAGKWSDL